MFRIGLTRDFLNPDGTVGLGDIGLGLLEGKPGIEHEFLAENARELRADQIRGYDALGTGDPARPPTHRRRRSPRRVGTPSRSWSRPCGRAAIVPHGGAGTWTGHAIDLPGPGAAGPRSPWRWPAS